MGPRPRVAIVCHTGYFAGGFGGATRASLAMIREARRICGTPTEGGGGLDVIACTQTPVPEALVFKLDDDRLGVLLNYVCSAILLAAACALLRRYGRRGLRGTLTELGMSLGYLLGGLVHDRFPNRAVRDVCAHRYFYPTFAASYAAMIASAWAWSGVPWPCKQ